MTLVSRIENFLTEDKADVVKFSMLLGQVALEENPVEAEPLFDLFNKVYYNIKKDIPQDWHPSNAEKFSFIIDWLNSSVLKIWQFDPHAPFMVDHLLYPQMWQGVLGFTCASAATILLYLCRELGLGENSVYAAGSVDHVWIEFTDGNITQRFEVAEDGSEDEEATLKFVDVGETEHMDYKQNRTITTTKHDMAFYGMLLETLLKIKIKSYQKSGKDAKAQTTLVQLTQLCVKYAERLYLNASSTWLCILASMIELDEFQHNDKSTTTLLEQDETFKKYMEKITGCTELKAMVGTLYKKANEISSSYSLNALLGCARYCAYSNDQIGALDYLEKAETLAEQYYEGKRTEDISQTRCSVYAYCYKAQPSEQLMQQMLQALHYVLAFDNKNTYLVENTPVIQFILDNITEDMYENEYIDSIRKHLSIVGLTCKYFKPQEWEENKIELEPDCCSYDQGFVLQSVFTCMDCSRFSQEHIGFCESCATQCHAKRGHMVADIGEKMFKCDCGNSKFLINACGLEPNKDAVNVQNVYNHNFSVLGSKPRYCYCDQEDDESEVRVQCPQCYDWFYNVEKKECTGHILTDEEANEFVCKNCQRLSSKKRKSEGFEENSQKESKIE
jgi:hypothetical protein